MIPAASDGLVATGLAGLPTLAFGFMLVVARVGSALLTGPGFGEADVPPSIRLGLALLLAILLYPLVQARLPVEPANVGTLLLLVAFEVMIGAWLGFVARVIVMALAIAGGLVSLMAGLSSVLQLDPAFGAQTTALQRMMNLASIALFFASGLYLYPLHAIIGSYDLIPPRSGLDGAGAMQVVITAVSGCFRLAILLAAPFIVTSLLWQSAIGLLGRLVPTIHVHLVTPPAQIMGGVALLALGLGLIIVTWIGSVRSALSLLPGL
jgi:flagellar biosynthetic protein FliR